ncbi:MAG: HEAT repeat domain-containing protein [Phycisphaerales bacterium]
MRRRVISLGAVAGAFVLAAGCASRSGSSGSRGDSQNPPFSAERVARYNDPLEVSRLREVALDQLLASARSEIPQARANSIEALADAPTRLEPLIAGALKDQNAGVRSTAALMIGRLGLRTFEAEVRPLLEDASPFVRASAIYALAKSGVSVDPSPLAGMLMRDPSPRVRAHAAFLLGEMGDPSALGLLRDAARDADQRSLQLQLAEAMVKLGKTDQLEVIRAALYPSSNEELENTALACQIAGQLQDEGSRPSLIVLTALKIRGQPLPAEIRLAAATALSRLGQPQGEFVADEYYRNGNPAIRAQSAFVYAGVGRPSTLPKLEMLMGDADETVRVAAAAAVVRVSALPARAAHTPVDAAEPPGGAEKP